MASKYWVVYVGIFVPLFLSVLSVVLVLLLKPGKVKPPPPRPCASSSDCQNGGACTNGVCTCTAQWTGDRCQTLALPPSAAQGATQACGLTPVQCVADTDCRNCGGTVKFVCTEMTGEDNWANLSGKYCLPEKPTDQCIVDTGPGTYDKAIPGMYTWQGWKDVETQKWTCTCEYPQFYPPALGGDNSGACVKSAGLCKFGIWHYPCMGKQCNLSPEQQTQLVGTSPLQNGYCQCDKVPCTTGAECASGECEDGVCIHQRTGLDPKTGLPVCVRDTCAPAGKWVGIDEPPYTYGRCECDPSAVDTGFGCTPRLPPPPKPSCPKNCSGHGTCLDTHECLCNAGYTGKDCATPVCSTPCTGRGECVGPNTCFCEPGTHYNVTTGICEPLIACTPAPAVNPLNGRIENVDKFSSADQTSCVTGSKNQLVKLCQSSTCLDPAKCSADGSDKWDTVDDNLTTCFKHANCAGIACGTNYCGTGVTSVVGPISQVPSSDNRACYDPPQADVARMCQEHNDGLDNTFLLYNASTDEYRCMPLQTLHNVTLMDVTLLQGMGLTGSFCVSFPDAAARDSAQVIDGDGLFAYYTVATTADLSESASSLSEGFLNLKALTAPTCTGYLYSFNATFSDMATMAKLSPSTPISLRIDAYPASRWTCKEQVNAVSVTQCAPAYTSDFQPVKLQPYTPTKGASLALNPQMDPEAASILIQNTQAWSTATTSLSPNVASVVKLEKLQPDNVFVNTSNHDQILQMACTEAYCNTGSYVTAFKLMVLAWKFMDEVDPQTLGGTCSFLTRPLFVKYKLTRSSSSVGAPVDLLTPAIQPDVFKLADGSKVAYYIDAVPVDMTRTYTYTLSAYVVSSRDDTTTTFNTAKCKSAAEEVMAITVDPYSESFCQQIRAPLADEGQLPPFTWLQNGVCYWDINNLAAIDYYCGMYKKSEFDVQNFQLGDQAGNCKRVMKSYPKLLSNWADSTCDPSKPYSAGNNYACIPVLPTLQATLAYTNMQVEGGGTAAVSGQGTLQLTLSSNSADGAVVVSLPQGGRETPAYKYLVCNYVLSYLDQADATVGVVWQATNATVKIVPDAARPNETTALSFVGLQKADVKKPRQTVLLVSDAPQGMKFNTDIVFSVGLTGSSAARVEVQQMGFTNNMPTNAPGNQCVQTAFGTMDYNTCVSSCNQVSTVTPGKKEKKKKKGKQQKMQLSAPATCFGTAGKYDTRVCRGWSVKDDPGQMRTAACDQNIQFEEGQQGLGSERNFKDRLTNLQAFYKSHHVGSDVKNADFDVNSLWKSYYNCGPSAAPDTYGVSTANPCDPADLACLAFAEVNGCGNKNVCNPWTYVQGATARADDYQPKFRQTRTCFPSASESEGVSRCCDCRGTYSISDDHVAQCKCNDGEATCGDGLKV